MHSATRFLLVLLVGDFDPLKYTTSTAPALELLWSGELEDRQ